MVSNLAFCLSALAALVPVGLFSVRKGGERVLLPAVGVAILGAGSVVAVRLGYSWSRDFATSIWLTILVCLLEFLIAGLWSPPTRRLSGLLASYLLLLGGIGTIWGAASRRPALPNLAGSWLSVHILLSICAYGLITLGAIAGLAVMIRARSLKMKQPYHWFLRLPALTDGEAMQIRFLAAGEAALGLSLATGFANNIISHGVWLQLDHKTLLSIGGFAVLGGLLIWHRIGGLRGRNGARLGLIIYLMVTLAYPGVKFVTDIVIG